MEEESTLDEEHRYPHAVFAGLVVDEAGRPVRAAQVGGVACYVVEDDGFERYVEAEPIDRGVLARIKELVQDNRDEVTRGMLGMLGKDDLFTKAMVDSSIKNLDQLPAVTLPEDARAWLGMLGFRIVINLHGEIVRLDLPAGPAEDDG
jgi:hypothetical protein